VLRSSQRGRLVVQLRQAGRYLPEYRLTRLSAADGHLDRHAVRGSAIDGDTQRPPLRQDA